MSLTEIYHNHVTQGTLNSDPAQISVLSVFDTLQAAIDGDSPRKRGLRKLLGAKTAAPPKGLYLFGGVGRGKSMLMDLFFDASPTTPKRRVHFHAFMLEIHQGMFEARKTGAKDAIEPVATQVAKSARLLCFDEMQITDIADAMIVGRLFEKLFESGVTIVTTSNRHPDDLYKDGLNRQLFLPFIKQIKTQLTIFNLDSENDHRQNRLQGQTTYFTPITKDTSSDLDALWNDLAGHPGKPMKLIHKSREITIPKFHNGIACASFSDLCANPLGAADYLEIARNIHVLILSDVPILGRENNNEAKRFVTLIDALYEAKIRLIVSAAAQPEQLYPTGAGAFEFERTASRLREMMSTDWVASPTQAS